VNLVFPYSNGVNDCLQHIALQAGGPCRAAIFLPPTGQTTLGFSEPVGAGSDFLEFCSATLLKTGNPSSLFL